MEVKIWAEIGCAATGALAVRDAGSMGAPGRAALAQTRMQQAAAERCALLETLLLLYYSRPLSVERWLELAAAVRSSLVLRSSAPKPGQSPGRRADHLVCSYSTAALLMTQHFCMLAAFNLFALLLMTFWHGSSSHMSADRGHQQFQIIGCTCLLYKLPCAGGRQVCLINGYWTMDHDPCSVQATMVLLQTLDLETLLRLVADNAALTADAHRFGGAADRERIDAELRSWWDGPSEAQTPVLLAWAAFTALANIVSPGGHDSAAHYNEPLRPGFPRQKAAANITSFARNDVPPHEIWHGHHWFCLANNSAGSSRRSFLSREVRASGHWISPHILLFYVLRCLCACLCRQERGSRLQGPRAGGSG